MLRTAMNPKQILERFSTALILVGMIVISSLLSPFFFTSTNIINILRQISIITILSFGQTMVIITGQIDLSIGAVAGMAGTFATAIFIATQNIFIAVGVALMMGATVGLVNGFIITKFGVPSFIVTLAMQGITSGIILSAHKIAPTA